MKESKQKKKVFFTMIKQSKLIETLIKEYLIKNNLINE